jgi:putative oxidoreductase
MNDKLTDWLIGGAGGGSALADAGLAILRITAGLALSLAHGLGKIPPSPRFVSGVEEMGFPFPIFFAWAAGLSEYAGGILLALGLFTRPAALFILFTMSIAFFIRHADDVFRDKERALLFLVIAAAFLLIGGGRYALDRVMRMR